MSVCRLSCVIFAFVFVAMLPSQAEAMYDPGTGRFMQRDPAGYVDGMNRYAGYHVMHGGVDPSGLQQQTAAPKPAAQCENASGPITLTFDGLTLSGGGIKVDAVSGKPVRTTVSEDWELRGAVFPNRNRRPAPYRFYYKYERKVFDYSVARQRKAGAGPAVEGTYWIGSCDDKTWKTKVARHMLASNAWGFYSWRMHPEANVPNYPGRVNSSFHIHGGKSAGSAGCIDIMGQDHAVNKIIEEAVEYMNDNNLWPTSTTQPCCCYVAVVVDYSSLGQSREVIYTNAIDYEVREYSDGIERGVYNKNGGPLPHEMPPLSGTVARQ